MIMREGETKLETLYHLYQLEKKSYGSCNYLKFVDIKGRELLEYRRPEICSWMYRFVDSYNLCRDLVSRAMSYFDRFLMGILMRKGSLVNPPGYNKSSFLQLTALISLHLAIKIHSKFRLEFRHMIRASRRKFDVMELVNMERHMLYVLAWRLNPPIGAEFVMQLGSLLSSKIEPTLKNHFSSIINTAIFFAELAVWDSYFLQYKASTVAIACLFNAAESLDTISQDERKSILDSLNFILDQFDVKPKENLYPVCLKIHEVFSNRERS